MRLDKNKIFSLVTVLLTSITLVPFVIASFYNHLYADDYSFARSAMVIIAEGDGLLKTVTGLVGNAFRTAYTQWSTWSGCYTSYFFSSVAPGVWGDQYVVWNIVILLGSFLVANWYFFRIILGEVFEIAKWKWISLLCVMLFLSIQFVPSIPEAFFWFNGAFYNIVGYSFGLLLLVLIIKLLCNGVNLKSWKRKFDGMLTIVIAVLFAGTNYSCILLYMVYYAFLILYLIYKRRYRDASAKWAILSLLVFYIFSFVNIAAPGNLVRQDSVGGANSALKSIYLALVYVGPFVRDHFSILQLLIVAASLPLVYDCTKKVHFNFKHPVFVVVASYLSLAVCFTPTCYSLKSLGPNRTLNVYYFFFILLLYVDIFYICGWINYNKGNIGREMGKSVKFTLSLYAEYVVGLVMLIMILVPHDKLMNMSSLVVTEELLSGDLKKYDEEVMERYLLYTDPEVKEVALKSLTVNPKSLTVNENQNISSDPDWWVNVTISQTYGKDKVYVEIERKAE